MDPRTPSTYYENRDVSRDSLINLKGKLDDLLTALQSLKKARTAHLLLKNVLKMKSQK